MNCHVLKQCIHADSTEGALCNLAVITKRANPTSMFARDACVFTRLPAPQNQGTGMLEQVTGEQRVREPRSRTYAP